MLIPNLLYMFMQTYAETYEETSYQSPDLCRDFISITRNVDLADNLHPERGVTKHCQVEVQKEYF